MTKYILSNEHYSISDSQPNFFIEKKEIKQVYECKTFGVTVDQHLSWKSNTDSICKKKNAGTFADSSRKTFALSLNYCCEIRDVFNETQSKRL